MSMRRLAPALVAAAWIGIACAGTDLAPTPYAQGQAAYDAGHYAEAVAHFRRAAAAGDPRSAEILALMLRFGPRLYPQGVPADATEAGKWAAVAAERRAADPAWTRRIAEADRP